MHSSRIDDKHSISIIIPSFNGKYLLQHCLPAVYTAIHRSGHPDVEVIIVDDASTDGTAEWIEQSWPDVRVIHLLSNSGFTRAINAGILASHGDWLGLLNNDTVVEKDWLLEAIPHMHTGVGSVATLILYDQNSQRVIDSAGDSYTVIGTALKRDHLQPFQLDSTPGLPIFSACAASAFYRRSALVEVGLFDEYLGAYYDDVDVGFRLQWAGFDCVYAPKSICIHKGNASYLQSSFRVWYQTSRNSEIVFWSNMSTKLLFRYSLSHIIFTFLQLIPALFSGSFLAYVLGKLSVLGFLPYILCKRKSGKSLQRRRLEDFRQRLVPNWVQAHSKSGFIRSA